ncbi:sulfotransferase 6B1-like isoform X2 [Elgaria multicarinata webbii]|uniref:sulfotransferase 6B1-like isoform X2 n=1 Tax=Elgaria multicarinata webbii TaxID=159646 RepID=UPI002FCD111D
MLCHSGGNWWLTVRATIPTPTSPRMPRNKLTFWDKKKGSHQPAATKKSFGAVTTAKYVVAVTKEKLKRRRSYPQRMNTYPPRRVMFTHLRPDKLPVSVFKNKAKILMLIRNPKDVAASFFHFSNTFSPYPPYDTFDSYFRALMEGQMPWGSYIEYLCVWNKYVDKENVMPITYEELKANTALGAEKISKFFELNLSEEDFRAVAERSTFKSMKENSKTTHGDFGNVLFRKGGVSDWKTLFNESNNKEMDSVFKERLAGTKVGSMIKYDVYCKA